MEYKFFDYMLVQKPIGTSSYAEGGFRFLTREGSIRCTNQIEEDMLRRSVSGWLKCVGIEKTGWQLVKKSNFQIMINFSPWQRFASLCCLGDGWYRADAEISQEPELVAARLLKDGIVKSLGAALEVNQTFPGKAKIYRINFELGESFDGHVVIFDIGDGVSVISDPFLRYGNCCAFHRFLDVKSNDAVREEQPQSSAALSTAGNGSPEGTIASFGASEEEEAQASDVGNADASQELHQTTLQETPNEASIEQPVPNATNEHETQATVEEFGNAMTSCRDVPSPMALIPRNNVQDQMREWLMKETSVYASSFCKHFPGYTFKTLRSIWYHTRTALHKQGYDQLAVLQGAKTISDAEGGNTIIVRE